MIVTPRFILRTLTVDDATERYSGWFEDDAVSSYVVSAKSAHRVADLRAYIEARAGREDVLFFGIFTRDNMEHIGNIKYEPINVRGRYAVMGMLIGDPAWRGKGVAEEVITASAEWLRRNFGITEIILGVSRDNPSAIKAYEKAGFKPEKSRKISADPAITLVMVRHLGPVNAG